MAREELEREVAREQRAREQRKMAALMNAPGEYTELEVDRLVVAYLRAKEDGAISAEVARAMTLLETRMQVRPTACIRACARVRSLPSPTARCRRW